MIATTVFANPLLHDRIDVIRTTSSLKKRFDGFGLDDDVSNNDKVLADIVSQNMIPNSNTNSIDLSDLAVDDTTTSININEPIADCISEDTPNIDQDPTQKRSTPKAVCPARENTQAPRASLFNFKNFNPFKKPDSNTQRKTRPGENPCTGPSLSLDGLSQSVHVSCGGPKVGVMGIRCDYVLNCMPGRSIFPVLTLNQKTYLYMTGVVSSIGDRTVFDPTIQTLQFCCHKHYDEASKFSFLPIKPALFFYPLSHTFSAALIIYSHLKGSFTNNH